MNYLKKYIKLIIVILGLLVLFYSLEDKIALYFDAVNIINTEINSSTLIAPVLETKIDPDKNLVYCYTAQMAWNCLHNNIIKETIEIENQPWYVEKLNQYVNLPPQISQEAYVANAGFGKDIIEKIKNELIKKFNIIPKAIIFPQINDNNIFAFSYLNKILDFKEKFGTFYSTMKFSNKSIKVRAFGFEGLRNSDEGIELKKQINLLYAKNGFIMELITTSEKDVMIISTVKPEDNLLKTYYKINALINDPQNPHKKGGRDYIQTVIIPKINFEIETHFKELTGKNMKNSKFKQYFIADAFQYIKFKLNERGARIESYFKIEMQMGDPLKLIVNGPFTIFIKDKTSTYPYFMAYIGNDDLLEK